MFRGYEFTFDGISSLDHGLILCSIGGQGQDNVSFGNVANIVETRIPNRVTPIHHGVRYNDKPLEFQIVFASENKMDRYEIQEVAMWLTGHQDYRWLTIEQPDMADYMFKCIITELKPISVSGYPVGFSANVRCDCPYAYGHPVEQSFELYYWNDIVLRNESSTYEYIKPHIKFYPITGSPVIEIDNLSDGGRVTEIIYESQDIVIDMDNENEVIVARDPSDEETVLPYNMYSGFNMNFFRLVHGDNILRVFGFGTLVITTQFLYNVAA